MESFRNYDIKLSKLVTKWSRSFILDSNLIESTYQFEYFREGKSFLVGN